MPVFPYKQPEKRVSASLYGRCWKTAGRWAGDTGKGRRLIMNVLLSYISLWASGPCSHGETLVWKHTLWSYLTQGQGIWDIYISTPVFCAALGKTFRQSPEGIGSWNYDRDAEEMRVGYQQGLLQRLRKATGFAVFPHWHLNCNLWRNFCSIKLKLSMPL